MNESAKFFRLKNRRKITDEEFGLLKKYALDNFDFTKVETAMKALDWKIVKENYTGYYSPKAHDLKMILSRLLDEAFEFHKSNNQDIRTYLGCVGFDVVIHDGTVEVGFEVASIYSNIDDI